MPQPTTSTRSSRVPAAVLLAGSGVVHLAAIQSHLATPLGVGFLVVGLAQLAVAVWLVRRGSATAVSVAVALQLTAIAAWAVSRTVGIPLSGEGVETIGLADTLTVLLQVGSLFALVGARSPRVAAHTFAVATLAFAFTLGGTGVAVSALATEAANHADHHADDADAAPDHHADEADVAPDHRADEPEVAPDHHADEPEVAPDHHAKGEHDAVPHDH